MSTTKSLDNKERNNLLVRRYWKDCENLRRSVQKYFLSSRCLCLSSFGCLLPDRLGHWSDKELRRRSHWCWRCFGAVSHSKIYKRHLGGGCKSLDFSNVDETADNFYPDTSHSYSFNTFTLPDRGGMLLSTFTLPEYSNSGKILVQSSVNIKIGGGKSEANLNLFMNWQVVKYHNLLVD